MCVRGVCVCVVYVCVHVCCLCQIRLLSVSCFHVLCIFNSFSCLLCFVHIPHRSSPPRSITPREFNSYGARRGNDAVMARGTFANIRLVNRLLGDNAKAAPRTLHVPSGDIMDVYDAAARYAEERTPVIILAGKDYGCGSSRDWAAKGPYLQVRGGGGAICIAVKCWAGAESEADLTVLRV